MWPDAELEIPLLFCRSGFSREFLGDEEAREFKRGELSGPASKSSRLKPLLQGRGA
jgi:hypothetical protein